MPNKHIASKASALTQGIPSTEPVVALHMRRTDKHQESSVAYVDNHVPVALKMISDLIGRQYKTLLVLSDDPDSIKELQNRLGPSFDVRGLSKVESLFNESKDYDEYRRLGKQEIITNNVLWVLDLLVLFMKSNTCSLFTT